MTRSLRAARVLAAALLLPAMVITGCPFHDETFHRACAKNEDCDDGNPCTDDVCSFGDAGAGTVSGDAGATVGICENPFSKKESACATSKLPVGVCDGEGACVQCLVYADCAADLMNPICDEKLHKCVSCDDGIKDGKETDVDCGGPDCGACLTKPCDPVHGCGDMTFCSANDKVCCSAMCTGICVACTMVNTGKGDGTCAPIPVGMDPFMQCSMTGTPAAGGCSASVGRCECEDAAMDGNETDIDCGGKDCPACEGGKKCLQDTDCAADVPNCLPSTHTCCSSLCGATCSTCATGQCLPQPVGFNDPNCPANTACAPPLTADPNCVGKFGAACGSNGGCLSQKCTAGTCAKGAAGAHCSGPNDCTSGTCQNFTCM